MPYEITATRKRPQGFEELAGQEFVSATLEASLASGRIAHAYLFSGPRGCGKTSTARILAKALNCEKGPTATPCGVCANCRSIAAGSSLDVIEIDGASNTSVEGVRQIKDEVLFPPNSARYKVYIIDEVHMLSMSAFNALLKTIEEPPPYVVFIFATTELHKVPATIKSRCQQFAFRLIPIDTIKERLASAAADLSVAAEDAALLWIAKESGGSLRDAYTLFDQVVAFSQGGITVAGIREKLGLVGLEAMNGLFEAIVDESEGAVAEALGSLDALLAGGVSPEQFVVDVIDYLRSLLLIAHGLGRESLLGAPSSAYSDRVLSALDGERIERGLGLFLELHRNLRMSPNPRFELELAVARLSRLRDYVSPSALARAVGALRDAAPSAIPSSRAAMDRGAPIPRAGEKAAIVDSTPPSEKKKPELKPSIPSPLSEAMSSLAGAVLGAKSGVIEASSPVPDADPEQVVEESGDAGSPPAAFEEEDVDAEGLFEDGGSDQGPIDLPSGGAEALKRELITRLGRQNPLLGSGLAASLDWSFENDRIVIPFRKAMEEGVVRGALPVLATTLRELMGMDLKIDLRVQTEAGARKHSAVPGSGVSDPVSIVERMFRGQRVEPRQRGGQDEFR